VTRRIGACLVTHGVGVTNAMTGLAAASMDGAPLLCLALGIPRERADLGNLQEMDHLAAVGPVTKWARIVPSAARIPEYVAAALRHAWAGQPGPVFLEVPGDVLSATVDTAPVTQPDIVRPLRTAADPAVVEDAARLLDGAERPVIFAGSGVWWSNAGDALARLAEKANIPVFTRRLARSTVAVDHPLNFGMAWLSMNGVSLEAAAGCDLLLLVGGHLYYDLEHGRPPYLNGRARVIQIDVDAAEIGQNRPADIAIAADARLALEQLGDAVGRQLVGRVGERVHAPAPRPLSSPRLETTNGTRKFVADFTHVAVVASPPRITSSWLIAVRMVPTTSAIGSVRRRCSRRAQ
jgi:acetolactate synthase-1/2/3 large subunit